MRHSVLALAAFACTPVETQEQPSSETPVEIAPAEVVPPTVTPPPVVVAKTPVPVPTTSVRAVEVIRNADDWRGHELVVDIYEPIRSNRYSSSAPTNGFDVDVADVGTAILNLVPDSKLKKLRADLKPPFRVRATLGRDAERGRTSGRAWSVLEVHEVSPLSNPKPVRAPSAAEILRDKATWHGKFVELEGEWLTGFEASIIDQIWIGMYPDAKIECKPKKKPSDEWRGASTHRVRLEGFLQAEGGYGHGGIADAQLTATHVAFLDTPGCTPSKSRATAE